MPILSMTAGRVTAIWGAAYYRQPDGSLQPVHVGDELVGGQQILTDQKGIVEIEPAVLSPKILKLIQAAADVDHTLKAIETHDPEAVPAAGLTLGGSGSLQPGLRVDRVSETVSPLDLGTAEPSSVNTPPHQTSNLFDVPQATLLSQSDSEVPTQPPVILPPPVATVPPGEHGVQVLTTSLSEEGLPGGNPDTMGTPDTTNATVQTVQLDMSTLSSTTGLSLVAPTESILTVTGQPLIWLSDGHGGLMAKTVNDPAAPNVLTAELDANTGAITVTLLAPLQHSSAGEDALTLMLGVNSTTSGTTTSEAAVAVSVEDDSPIVVAPAPLPEAATNLMIMLDVSSGMVQPNGPNRLEATVQAVDHLLDQYAEAGQVAVRLVTFADTAHVLGNQWVSVDTAKMLLSTLIAHGGVQYDAALLAAESAFQTDLGRLPDAQNVSYLFTGNAPVAGSLTPIGGTSPSGAGLGTIDASEEAAWIRFLTDNHIVSNAVGMGSQVKHADLDPVAYDGLAALDHDAVLVANPGALAAVLNPTVVTTLKGSLLNGLSMGADGFGAVRSIEVDGQVHVVDPAAPVMTLHTDLGATFTVNVQTGQYTYTPPAGTTGMAEVIHYQVADKDGDVLLATIGHANATPQGATLDLRDVLQVDSSSAHALGLDGQALHVDLNLSAHAASAAVINQLLTQGSLMAA